MITAPVVLVVLWMNGLATMWPMFTEEQCKAIGSFTDRHEDVSLAICMDTDKAKKFWQDLLERSKKNNTTGS